MNFTDSLAIDKVYCVTTFNNIERLNSILQLKKQLNIEIDLIACELDSEPRMSFNKTMIKILKSSKELNHKILIFEDDVTTELSNLEILNRISSSGVSLLEYDILSLGSICYQKKEINDSLYSAEVFGYTHAVVYDLKNIKKEFLDLLHQNIIVNKMGFDSGLCNTSRWFNNAIVFKESLFTQKNFDSISGGMSEIYNIGWLYKSKYDLCHNYTIRSIEKFPHENKNNYILKQFKSNQLNCIKIDFEKNSDMSISGELTTKLTDIESGIIFNIQKAYDCNYWVVSECPVSKILIEIINNQGVCYFRKSVDLNSL